MHFRKFLYTVSLALCGFVAQANAVPTLVGTWSGSSGEATENAAVGTQIFVYNLLVNPDVPWLFDINASLLPGWVESPKVEVVNGSHTFLWTAPGTYSEYYVLSKYGQGQGSFDHALHYLAAGDAINYNPGGASAPNGLSHYRVWGRGSISVPDGGATVLLLGLGLSALALVRRRSA